MSQSDFLLELSAIIENRLTQDVTSSYVASLNAKGVEAILKKVIEEATEVVMATKEGSREKIVYEIADLWFHTLVLLGYHGLTAEHILTELKRRQGESGLAEKASRLMK